MRRMYSIVMMVVGLESCMEDVGLISGAEQLIYLAMMVGLIFMVGKDFVWSALERGTLIT